MRSQHGDDVLSGKVSLALQVIVLLLSTLHALSHGGPDVPFVLPQRVPGLRLGDGPGGVLLGLVANIAGQGHHSVDHVAPVLPQPRDGVHLTAVVDSHLDILRGEARLLCLLERKYVIEEN